MRRLSFIVRPAPDPLNKMLRVHWSKRRRQQQRIMAEIDAQIRDPRKAWPESPIAIRALRKGWNKLDPDSAVAAMKPVIDALVTLEMIPDDTEAHVKPPILVEQVIRRQQGQLNYSELQVLVSGPVKGLDPTMIVFYERVEAAVKQTGRHGVSMGLMQGLAGRAGLTAAQLASEIGRAGGWTVDLNLQQKVFLFYRAEGRSR